MATTTNEESGTDDDTACWRVRGRTTIELRQRGTDEWLATQRGVGVEGRGRSAAAAAVAYCRAIDADEPSTTGENGTGT